MIERITRVEVLKLIHAHALRAYPRECCGMICDGGEVRECENAIDRFHAEDPDAFPRTSANGYCFDFEDMRILNDSFATDSPVIAIYHSHPNGDATFSKADRNAAMHDGVPIYPTLLHLIVAIDATGVRATRCYGYADGAYRELFADQADGEGNFSSKPTP